VEFVNFLLALGIMAAAWTLVVEVLGRYDENSRRARYR